MDFRTFQRYVDSGETPKKTGRSQDVEFTYTGSRFNRPDIEEALCGSTRALMRGFTWNCTPSGLSDTWASVYNGSASLNSTQIEYLEFLLTLDR